MRRLVLGLGPALLLLAACGAGSSTPSIDDVAARWPASAGSLTPVAAGVQDHYGSVLARGMPGDPEVRLYQLDGASLGLPWQVLVVRGSAAYSAHDVNDLRCRFLDSLGSQQIAQGDAYGGSDGLHGHDGIFSVDADGVAVLVMDQLTSDQAHTIAKALGGTDDHDQACSANTGVRGPVG